MRVKSYGLKVAQLAVLLARCDCCRINGYDSGECSIPSDHPNSIPFCAEVVTYSACMPIYNELYRNHTRSKKDQWVEQWYTRIIEERTRHELNATLEDMAINELGEGGIIQARFGPDRGDSPDCVKAFKNYFCWMNFPRCDQEDKSLVMCRSACENLHIACNYEQDLWRCGSPEFFYGYRGEKSLTVHDTDGTNVYYRYPYPGAPFRDYQDPTIIGGDTAAEAGGAPVAGAEIAVCTPSIKGAASSRVPFGMALCLLLNALLAVASAFRWC